MSDVRRPRRASASAVALVALVMAAGAASAGSLYPGASSRSLTADLRARLPGDTLTVVVLEESRAAASAETNTDRSVDLRGNAEGSVDGVGGGQATGELELESGFVGKGAVNRSGRLLARVSVVVKEAYPNGDLLVNGEQEIVLNQETQSIVITGRVRPADITKDNTVLSSRLSDAVIEYTGQGILADTERKSWWNRVLEWIF